MNERPQHMPIGTLLPRRGPLALVLLSALALAACGDLPLARDSAAVVAEENRALRLSGDAEHLQAARIYARLASEGPSGERTRYATLAAGEYLAAGRLEDARRLLPPPGAITTTALRLDWAPVAARLALAEQRPGDALDALGQLPDPLPRALEVEVLALEAEALFALGQPRRGVQALITRGRLLAGDADARLANHWLIWQALQGGGRAVLAAGSELPDDPELAGWLALGPVAINAARNPQGVTAAIAEWRGRFPGHPAAGALLAEVLASYRGMLDQPQRIALILPLSGRQQGAGEAVRDGFMAAYFEHRGEGERASVQVYDSAGGAIAEIYRAAVLDGADFIVGPLLREELDAVAPLAGQVPTLALNQLGPGSSAPPSLFQFALAPEDEAEQVARLASRRHGPRAVALIPNDDWGRRVLASFSEALRAEGGRLLEFATYETWEQDFSLPITRMLQIDQSEERRRRLAAIAGTRLEFQPRRRQDADFLFLAARTPQARLIRPQLRYFFAGDLPTYAPSAVFQPGGAADGDLNGIVFPDAPWLLDPDAEMLALRRQIESAWPGRGERLGRLYAMGFDAYRLVPLLFSADRERGVPSIDGMSGRLTVAADGRVQRTLAWAQFRGGRPVALELPLSEPLDEPGPEADEAELARVLPADG